MNDRYDGDSWVWDPPPEGQATPAAHQPGPPGPTPPPGTNGLAIASLVLSLVWCYWVGSILAVVFGHVALSQIRRSRGTQTGRGLALAGVVVGWLSIAAGVVFAVLLMIFWDELDEDVRGEDGAIVNRGEISVDDLRVGDCLNIPDTDEIYSVEAVPCDQLHQHEVYALFELGDGAYPGDERVVRSASAGCRQRFRAYVGKRYGRTELEMWFHYPNRTTWRMYDDREVICYLTQRDEAPLTGSLAGSRR